jgi:hypothetical protein
MAAGAVMLVVDHRPRIVRRADPRQRELFLVFSSDRMEEVMSSVDLTEPERLALAYVLANEAVTERDLARRRSLQGLVDRLLNAAPLTKSSRAVLGYAAKREIETNRYPLAFHLELLKSAFAKLCPADEPPQPPPTTGRRRARR